LEKKVGSSSDNFQELHVNGFGVSFRLIWVGLVDYRHLTHSVGLNNHFLSDWHARVTDQHLLEVLEVKSGLIWLQVLLVESAAAAFVEGVDKLAAVTPKFFVAESLPLEVQLFVVRQYFLIHEEIKRLRGGQRLHL
jgi:hypothetical protein